MGNLSYEKVLNKAQLEAVMTTEGPVLVIAGAGSGKTRTIVYRVARLIELGVPPSSILLLTFTKKAAKQMLERAARIQDERCRFVVGGTFHSFANRILRRYSREIGFRNGFSLIDRSDTEQIISSIISDIGKNRRFPKKGTVADIISKSANTGRSIEDILKDEYEHFIEFADQIKKIELLYREYKKAHSLIDYDDLLIYLKKLLEVEDIRERISDQFRYIMVDEYQDTNRIQADILEGLCFLHKNIMAVGDDSQAIYSFRGADFRNMFDFPKRFPGTKIIKLEENYRSTQPILNFTNALMKHAIRSYTKCLYTRRKGGKKPEIVNARSESEQAKFVCSYIKEQIKKGYSLKDIAVLFRASHHSFELEAELSRQRIPYVKYGGFKFLESAHIKDFLSYLKAFLNRDDVISWTRILLLVRNIGPAAARSIYEWMKEKEVPAEDIKDWPGMKERYSELKRLSELFSNLSKASSPKDAAQLTLEYYTAILQEKFDDWPRRKKELEQLVLMAERYRSLKSFIDDLFIEPPESPDDLSEKKDDLLTLSTVHSAKGLEWAIVIIICASEGRFPLLKARQSVEEIEEERRLMYVAATRAKDHLVICYPGGELSSFIREVPKGLMSFKEEEDFFLLFNPGDRVYHPKFGEGKVIRMVGKEKIEVLFYRAGRKLLHLGYTTLDKI